MAPDVLTKAAGAFLHKHQGGDFYKQKSCFIQSALAAYNVSFE